MARTAHRDKGGTTGFRREGDVTWIIPLAGGKFAYVLDPASSKSPRYTVGSDAFNAAIGAIVEAGREEEVREQLTKIGWTDVLTELDASGVFGSAEGTDDQYTAAA